MRRLRRASERGCQKDKKIKINLEIKNIMLTFVVQKERRYERGMERQIGSPSR